LPAALQAKLEYLFEHSPQSIRDIALAAVSTVEKRLREVNIIV
jgi:hypothetical protein